jgi:alpha-tubulin suppressor-like RCC1 family protein
MAVATGLNFTLALKSDGTLWAWGYNGFGQLGDNTTTQRTYPVQVGVLTNVIAIAAGDNHSIALTSDGYVWTWGQNSNGQLGNGTTTVAKQPQQVATAPAMAIGAGANHTLIVKVDGTVWGMGVNSSGQLGDGTNANPRTTPVQMNNIDSAVAVAGGNAHSLVLLANGTLKATGSNGFGQLGDSTNTQRLSPASVTMVTNVTQIAASQAHSYAVRNDGTMWSWGLSALGAGTVTQRNAPAQISELANVGTAAAGGSHGLAVSTAGVVWTWGDNAAGQLGDGSTADRSIPGAISDVNYAWKIGTPTFSVAAGTYNIGKTVVVSCATPGAEIHYTVSGATPTQADPIIASGASLVIDQTTTLEARAWKTGYPTSNIEVAIYSLTPVKPVISPAGGSFSTAQSITISTTTSGSWIRYTLDGTPPSESSTLYAGPLTVGTSTTVKATAFRTGWTPSLIASATLTMNFGTIAAPTVAPLSGVYASTVTVIMNTAAGGTIRYTTNGAAPTTSSPAYTGPVDITTSSTVTAKAFHPDYTTSPPTSATYTIVVEPGVMSPNGGTYTMGQIITASSPTVGANLTYTLNGAAPLATDPPFPTNGIVAGNVTLKVAAWKAGATPSLVTTATYQVIGATARGQIFAGGSHSFAIRPDGIVFAWGSNASGQIGDGTTISRSTPVLVNGVTGAVAGAAGDSHSLAVDTRGTTRGWGANTNGRLGDNSTTNRLSPTLVNNALLTNVTSVAAGLSHSLAIDGNGAAWAWGYNAAGQLGIGNTNQQLVPVAISSLADLVSVAAGQSSSFALKADGTVWSWGANASGQLGMGDTSSRLIPEQVQALSAVQAIAPGGSHTLALMGDATVRTWGLNSSGQLGDGTINQHSSPNPVVGLSGVVAIAAGSAHSIALLSDGNVWAWGSNSNGQVGNGSGVNRFSPVQVTGLPAIASISAGKLHSLALGEDGSIWAWGRNTERQLGDGTTTNRSSPVMISAAGAYAASAATPTFTPSAGTYAPPLQVVIATQTAPSTIRWTSDGSDPNDSSPIYTGPIDVLPGSSITLKARAFRTGWNASQISAGTFVSWLGSVPTPTAIPGSGSIDAFVAVRLQVPDPMATIRYTTDGTTPTETSARYFPYAPIILSASTTLNARAFRAGYAPSGLMVADYQLNGAPTQLSLNGEASSVETCVLPASGVNVVVANGPGNPGDWLGLYERGAPHTEYLDWSYLNGMQEVPETGVMSGSVVFSAPSQPGEYEIRLCHDDRFDCVRRSAQFMVAQSGACVAISSPHSGTTSALVSAVNLQANALTLADPLELVSFFDGTTVIGTVSSTPYNLPWPVPFAQVYALTASANIGPGAPIVSRQVILNITDTELSVNGAVTPSRLTVSAGSVLTVALASETAFSRSTTLGIYRLEDGDASPVSWVYLNGTKVLPQVEMESPTIQVLAPSSQGVYQARLCAEQAASCYVASALVSIGLPFAVGDGSGPEPTPIAWPSPGMHGPYQIISLAGSDDASVRFTLDGTSPNATSPVYTGPFQITRSVQVRARAFGASGGVSGLLVADYTVDNTLPFITPTFSPGRNALGWNNTDVTVSSICTDDQSGVATCPQPVTVTGESANHPVTVRSRDVAGNWGTLNISVMIDHSAPAIAIASPATGTTTELDSVILRGTATDALSGIATVTCDGLAASVIVTAFHCTVPLSGGGNTITIQALDRAGNATTILHTLHRDVTPKVTSLEPNWGHVGDAIVIHGANFGPNGSVTFNGDLGSILSWDGAAIAVQVPAGATSGPVVVSTSAGPSSGTTFTVTTGQPPTITSQVSPTTPASGWHKTDVTVSFVCASAESSITSCTNPTTLTAEGPGLLVQGEAVDLQGNRASTSVILNVDRTGPTLTLHNLEDGEVVPPDTVQIDLHGNAADFTSGIALVTCNGAAASIEGQRYMCAIPVNAGASAIHVVAEDLAGNTTVKDLSVTVGDAPAPTLLEISPAKMTLLPGEERKLQVNDQRGSPVTGGTFVVTNDLVAQVILNEANVPFVRALHGGETTITLTREGLMAVATVTVLPEGATQAPSGTVLWALNDTAVPAGPPTRGRVLRATPSEVAGDQDPVALFYVEYKAGGKLNRIRATTWDGRELWRRTVNDDVKHVAADNHGGLVLVLGSEYPEWRFLHAEQRIQRLNGQSGSVDWEYVMHKGSLTEVAIHPDGTVYSVETLEKSASLLVLDGNTGVLRTRHSLSTNGQHSVNATAPMVRDDGVVVVMFHRWNGWWHYDNSETILTAMNSTTLGVTQTAVETDELSADKMARFEYDDLDRLISDGQGGMLVVISQIGMVFRVGSDSDTPYMLMSNQVDLRFNTSDFFPQLSPQIVLAENGAYALSQSWAGGLPEPAKLLRFDPVTLQVISSTPLNDGPDNLLHSATPGGGVMMTGPAWANAQEVALGLWAQWEPAPALVIGDEIGVADTESAYWQGNAQGGNAPRRPGVSIFVGVDPLSIDPPITASMFEDDARLQFRSRLLLNVFRTERATAAAFLAELRKPGVDAIAIIGHGTRGTPDAGEAIGMKLYDKWIIASESATASLPTDSFGITQPHQRESNLTTSARIVFTGACWIGQIVQSMWRIDEGRGALVIPEPVGAPPGATIGLNRAAAAWLAVLRRLTGQFNGQRMSIGDAVDSVNVDPIITNVPAGQTTFILRVVMNRNVKLQ